MEGFDSIFIAFNGSSMCVHHKIQIFLYLEGYLTKLRIYT